MMGISVSIVAGENESASSVIAIGTIKDVITDEDRTTFHLGDEQLKDAVHAYFGKSPVDAYLSSPTPWNDLYKTYNWQQVHRVLTVKSAEILSITSEPVIVKTQEFKNSSTLMGSFNVAISESVNNTTSSKWTVGGSLTIAEKITVGFDAGFKPIGLGAEGRAETETSLSVTASVGHDTETSETISVGSSTGVTIDIPPGKSIIAELSASRGVMKVRIRYIAQLNGRTAVNYHPKYKGHHFYSLGVNRVMLKSGISNSIESTQEIEIGYYSNSKIELRDSTTLALTETHVLDDIPGD